MKVRFQFPWFRHRKTQFLVSHVKSRVAHLNCMVYLILRNFSSFIFYRLNISDFPSSTLIFPLSRFLISDVPFSSLTSQQVYTLIHFFYLKRQHSSCRCNSPSISSHFPFQIPHRIVLLVIFHPQYTSARTFQRPHY